VSPHISVDVHKLQAALLTRVTGDIRYGVFITDTDLRILLWNRWMEQHTGRLASDAIGRLLFELYPELESRGMGEYYAGALKGELTVVSYGLHRFVLALPPTNPELGIADMPQSGRISPLVDGETVIGTMTTIENVSERLASEIELRRQVEAHRAARAIAERALRAKDEFLATLSHEIRTPLNAVLGWSRILMGRESVDPVMLGRALQVIERNATAQTKMIDDMLDMARIVSGKLRLDLQPVDVTGAVAAAIDVVTPAATAKRIALRSNIAAKSAHVLGDADRLQQIVWNLLSNAVKFTDSGGTVDVSVVVSEPVVRITVADSGQGIPRSFLPFVFDRFRQNDPSSTRRHGGLGLGLALVRDLVELHGGSVRADSPGDGRGATFTIELPLAIANAPGEAYDSRALQSEAASLKGVKVLLVEDEADARDLAVTVLKQRGAEVIAVGSAADALTAIVDATAAEMPDVLVSDIAMAGEDGYELIRRVRSLEPRHGGRIPALALTGYAGAADVERALKAGYQRHVAKPMDPEELVRSVMTLLRREA